MPHMWEEPPLILEDGFAIDTDWQPEVFHNRNLLSNGLPHLLNSLADLLERKEDSLSLHEWRLFENCLFRIMRDSDKIYAYLIRNYGADAIRKSLWIRLASDLPWPACAQVFTDMPTDVLEESGEEIRKLQIRYHGLAGRKSVVWENEACQAIGQRRDIYGINSMPTELAFGILFEGGEG